MNTDTNIIVRLEDISIKVEGQYAFLMLQKGSKRTRVEIWMDQGLMIYALPPRPGTLTEAQFLQVTLEAQDLHIFHTFYMWEIPDADQIFDRIWLGHPFDMSEHVVVRVVDLTTQQHWKADIY